MPTPIPHNLGQDKCDALNKVLRDNPTILPGLQLLKEVGYPVDDMIGECQRQINVATTLKAALFPHMP